MRQPKRPWRLLWRRTGAWEGEGWMHTGRAFSTRERAQEACDRLQQGRTDVVFHVVLVLNEIGNKNLSAPEVPQQTQGA